MQNADVVSKLSLTCTKSNKFNSSTSSVIIRLFRKQAAVYCHAVYRTSLIPAVLNQFTRYADGLLCRIVFSRKCLHEQFIYDIFLHQLYTIVAVLLTLWVDNLTNLFIKKKQKSRNIFGVMHAVACIIVCNSTKNTLPDFTPKVYKGSIISLSYLITSGFRHLLLCYFVDNSHPVNLCSVCSCAKHNIRYD